jgi:hypothetical protein
LIRKDGGRRRGVNALLAIAAAAYPDDPTQSAFQD